MKTQNSQNREEPEYLVIKQRTQIYSQNAGGNFSVCIGITCCRQGQNNLIHLSSGLSLLIR